MKPGLHFKIIVFFALFFLISGCGGGGGDNTERDAVDTINIISVTPAEATEGEPTEFSVNFDYRLASKTDGIINLGFNTTEVSSYRLVAEHLIVTQGTGRGTIIATATPTNYSSPDSFEAFIIISEYPHPDFWTPLASHTTTINVHPIVAEPTSINKNLNFSPHNDSPGPAEGHNPLICNPSGVCE